MTEHTKIPLPGKSLLERAESALAGDAYSPAPVPSDLARPVNRRVPKRGAAQSVDDGLGQALASPRAFAPVEPISAQQTTTAPEAAIERLGRLDIVHEVDRAKLAHHGLIDPEGQVSTLLEEFRIVKRQVLQSARAARPDGDIAKAQRVLICSPLPGEGKSFTAANLALAMAAEKDGEVLLVDADFAKPSLLSMFGLPRGPGFMDVLANPDISLEDCILSTDIAGLHILPAGNHTNSDSEYLASARTGQVLDMLTRGAPGRIVIFDSPPALAASPAAELANHVGQAIVVARADRTGQNALEDALTLLAACPDIKLLLNAAHFSPSGRRFGAYYGEGE